MRGEPARAASSRAADGVAELLSAPELARYPAVVGALRAGWPDLTPTALLGDLLTHRALLAHWSCAYDPASACPLAPPGNVLPDEVPVGELS